MLRFLLTTETIAILFAVTACGAADQGSTAEPNEVPVSRGRYVPELYGASRGRWVPDDSGRYHHIHIPYDGGYGDRGLMYEHDERGRFLRPPGQLSLGPNDHLRFMIDFNYNGSGWQIIQFEWIRDGEEQQRYNYVNENRLWGEGFDNAGNDRSGASVESAYGAPPPSSQDERNDDTPNTDVHVEGDYDVNNEGAAGGGDYESNNLNVSYSNDKTSPDPEHIRSVIGEVLDYIQSYILPTLR